MIAIISPAKNMQIVRREELSLGQPAFYDDAKALAGILKECQPYELEELMHVNPRLAVQAFLDYQNWDSDRELTAALLAYHGLQYRNIQPEDFTAEDFRAADERLRIISGLYGVLRPTDGIMPYRLEMQYPLPIPEKTLYCYWGSRIYENLFASRRPVINLASGEYAKTVERYLRPGDRMIECRFCRWKNGKLKTVATSAKMARGRMVRFIIKERLTEPEQLKDFQWDGYGYAPERSGENCYVFVAEE